MRTIVFLLLVLFTVPTALAKSAAPNFNLATDRGKISLKQQRGKVVYVDFWATWCVPCRKSFPWMNEMHKKYRKKGLEIIAINLDENRKNVARFLKKYPAKFKIAYDPKGKSAEAYKVSAMPSSYLIDKRGKIISKHFGFRNKDKEKLEAEIRKALGLK